LLLRQNRLAKEYNTEDSTMNHLRKKLVFSLAIFLTAAAAFAGAPVKDGLVLYFPTVDARVKDFSGSKNTAQASALVVSNSPSLVSMEQTHQLSYCAWINPASIPHEFPILLSKGGNSGAGDYGGYEFSLNANGNRDLIFCSGAFLCFANTDFITTNLNQWIHVAFTIDTTAQTFQFYVNGQPVDGGIDTGTFADVNFDLTNNLYIGETDPAANKNRANFDGKMRQVMLFNRALSADEIQTIILKTAPK
jgi:hypothetical protein